uniref:HUN domain-containing protein n=1 Tax=Parastrongyloides trichosuri TaxID=131310 RepID=A0A0N4ZFC3_PARTI
MGTIIKVDKNKWKPVDVEGESFKDPKFRDLISIEEYREDSPPKKKAKKDKVSFHVIRNCIIFLKKKGKKKVKEDSEDDLFDDYVNEDLFRQQFDDVEIPKQKGLGEKRKRSYDIDLTDEEDKIPDDEIPDDKIPGGEVPEEDVYYEERYDEEESEEDIQDEERQIEKESEEDDSDVVNEYDEEEDEIEEKRKMKMQLTQQKMINPTISKI